jgi:hypothetical protein
MTGTTFDPLQYHGRNGFMKQQGSRNAQFTDDRGNSAVTVAGGTAWVLMRVNISSGTLTLRRATREDLPQIIRFLADDQRSATAGKHQ